MRFISLAIFLCVFWLASSGRFEPLFLGSMVVSCAVVIVLSARLRLVDAEGHPVELLPRVIPFWCWLTGRVAQSNLRVARLVLSRRPRISPRVVRCATSQRDDLGRTVHANCVTLTPGTVTVEVGADHLLIHELVASGNASGRALEFERRVAAFVGIRP